MFGQKKFEVVLSFPDTQVLTDLRIQIDNGLGRTIVPYKIVDNNQVMLSDFYYSKYAAVIISLPNPGSWDYRNLFFLDEKSARIKFLPAPKDSSPLDNYALANAYDFKSERDKMKSYDASETAEVKKYFEKHEKEIFDGNHKDLQDQFFEMIGRFNDRNYIPPMYFRQVHIQDNDIRGLVTDADIFQCFAAIFKRMHVVRDVIPF